MTGVGEEFIHILAAGVTDQLLVGIQNVVILRVCLVDQKCTGKILGNIPECKAETEAFLRMKVLNSYPFIRRFSMKKLTVLNGMFPCMPLCFSVYRNTYAETIAISNFF